MIKRTLFNTVIEKFNSGKAIVLLGPRQVGKTTLINTCLADKKFLFLNGDDPEIRDLLEGAGVSKLKAILGENKTVFIDEAQRIKDVGLCTIIVQIKELKYRKHLNVRCLRF